MSFVIPSRPRASFLFRWPVSVRGMSEGEPAQKRQRGMDGEPVTSSPLRVRKLSSDATIPVRGSARAAGYDLFAAADAQVPAQGKALIRTDLALAIPTGYYGRVAPRSGLALKHHIDVGAGVIDEDYRGPLGVLLFNFGSTPFDVKKGDRVAQLLVEKIITPPVLEVDDLDATDRGAGGFGSTGK